MDHVHVGRGAEDSLLAYYGSLQRTYFATEVSLDGLSLGSTAGEEGWVGLDTL